MATDTTAPLAIKAFREMGGRRVGRRQNGMVIDHAAPAPNERIANLHQMMREFSAEQHLPHFYDIGSGICHQLMVENGHVRPGDIFLVLIRTPTLRHGAFAVGVGSTDLAAAMLTGKTWLKVPHTIKIVLEGTLRPGITAKDVILRLVGDPASPAQPTMPLNSPAQPSRA